MNYTALNVTATPQTDASIINNDYRTYSPYPSAGFGVNNEIRIPIYNQDGYTYPGDSYLVLEGKLTKSVTPTGTEGTAFKDEHHQIVINGYAFLFSEIRYELNGTVIDQTRNPGITGLLKGLCSFPVGSVHLGGHNGFADTKASWNYITGYFHVHIPLNHLLGFCEDFKHVLINIRQELVLVRANTNVNALYSDNDDSLNLELTSVRWRIRHVMVNDAQRLKLLEVLNTDPWLNINFTGWELHEMPLLQTTTQHTWAIKTAPRLETPRYLFVAFQTARKANIKKDMSIFDNIKLKDIKLYLNGMPYPYDNINGDIVKGIRAPFYDLYTDFQRSFYGKAPRPYLASMDDFFDRHFFVVIDCSKQPETIKSGSVDVRLEWLTAENVAATTTAYCLILHDRFVQYKPLTSAVQIL
jgi:hypothetical protein